MSLSIAFLLTAAVGSPVAAEGNASRLKTDLSTRYAEMKSAMASKDESAIRSLLAPGFVSVDVGGKSEDGPALLKDVLALPADPSRQSHTTVVSVSGSGNAAIVEQRYEMTKRAKAADGTDRSVALTTVSRDNWIKDKGVWRIARTVTEQLDYSIDGVTVLHKVNPTK